MRNAILTALLSMVVLGVGGTTWPGVSGGLPAVGHVYKVNSYTSGYCMKFVNNGGAAGCPTEVANSLLVAGAVSGAYTQGRVGCQGYATTDPVYVDIYWDTISDTANTETGARITVPVGTASSDEKSVDSGWVSLNAPVGVDGETSFLSLVMSAASGTPTDLDVICAVTLR